jgi:prepilin-type N-terminal cleavage/methylation domain-containing protein
MEGNRRRSSGGGAASATRSEAGGFSLVEVLIAVIIVLVGSMSTVSLLTLTRIENDMEQERARAHQIVSERMEEIQRDLYTFITPGTQVTVWDNGTPEDTSDDTLGTLEVIARDTDGTQIAAAPNPPVRVQVEVTLSWNPRGRLAAKTMRETVMTYIAP